MKRRIRVDISIKVKQSIINRNILDISSFNSSKEYNKYLDSLFNKILFGDISFVILFFKSVPDNCHIKPHHIAAIKLMTINDIIDIVTCTNKLISDQIIFYYIMSLFVTDYCDRYINSVLKSVTVNRLLLGLKNIDYNLTNVFLTINKSNYCYERRKVIIHHLLINYDILDIYTINEHCNKFSKHTVDILDKIMTDQV